MAFQAVPGTASVTSKFKGKAASSLEGSTWQWVFYVNIAASWTGTLLGSLAAYTKDWFEVGKDGGSPALSVVSSNWVLDDVIARDLSVANGAAVTEPAELDGTRAGDSLPSTVAMIVTYVADPGQNPPKWWQFPAVGTESDVSGNLFTQAFVNEVNSRVGDYVASLADPLDGGTVGFALVGVSRSLGMEDYTARRAVRRAIAETGGLDFVQGGRRLVASQRDRRPV